MTTLATLPSTAAAMAALTTLMPRKAAYADLPATESDVTDHIATDGKKVVVNPGFATGRSEDEATYMVAFITTMLANDHIGRRGDRHPRLWETACNIAINNQLEDQGVPGRPDIAMHVRALNDRTSDEIYDLMMARDPVMGETVIALVEEATLDMVAGDGGHREDVATEAAPAEGAR